MTKSYSFCTCNFTHDAKKRLLTIEFLIKGKKAFVSCINNIKARFAKRFVNSLSEQELQDIYKTNMEIL